MAAQTMSRPAELRGLIARGADEMLDACSADEFCACFDLPDEHRPLLTQAFEQGTAALRTAIQVPLRRLSASAGARTMRQRMMGERPRAATSGRC